MSNPSCQECERDIPGITFVIPGDAWESIANGDRFLCPWCASARLKAAGLSVKACVNINLPGFDGTTLTAITAFEAIDTHKAKAA